MYYLGKVTLMEKINRSLFDLNLYVIYKMNISSEYFCF